MAAQFTHLFSAFKVPQTNIVRRIQSGHRRSRHGFSIGRTSDREQSRFGIGEPRRLATLEVKMSDPGFDRSGEQLFCIWRPLNARTAVCPLSYLPPEGAVPDQQWPFAIAPNSASR